jgi:putative nucleotidyltransferase-like protein
MDDLHRLGLILAAGESAAAAGLDRATQDRLWHLAVQQWLHLPLAWRILADADSWTDCRRTAARAMLADAAVLEEVQRRELETLVAAIAAAGVRALLLKGAAWAYTAYPEPILRSRDDTDLLIDVADRDRAARALVALGYRPAAENTADLATAQRHFLHVDARRVNHPVDLHWRVANPLAFAGALPFMRVWPRSEAVPAVVGARALCAVDSLLLACVHRLAHHGDDSNLVWVYDIHLLAHRLTADCWRDLAVEAASSGLCRVTANGLSRSADLFGTAVPSGFLARLAAADEPRQAAFLRPRVTPLDALASDWRALDTWAGRLRLLRAHVLPARAYMAAKYGTDHAMLLPLLYAHRALGGLPRWVSGSRRAARLPRHRR